MIEELSKSWKSLAQLLSTSIIHDLNYIDIHYIILFFIG